MVWLGVVAAAAVAIFLVTAYLRTPKVARYPAYGLVGFAVIAVMEVLLYLGVDVVTIYFTPLAWTGYIMAVDAAVYALRGRSMIRSQPDAFVWMVVLSIFLWLIFEAYNLHLRNWTYVGLPASLIPRYLGYGWSFATIWPVILETADFLLAASFRSPGAPPEPAASRKKHLAPIVAGLAMLVVPRLAPLDLAVYLFGWVWLGFIFFLDPLNYRAGRPSIWNDLGHGYKARLWALMISGLICGLFWEFWNYWAAAKWLYIFPILENWRLFEMPVLGFLGFPAFAVEVFAMYIFATALLSLPSYEIGAGPDSEMPVAAKPRELGDIYTS